MKAQCIKEMQNAPDRQIKLLKSLQLAAILLVIAFFANGCALTKDYVVLSYDPQLNVEKIKGADAVKVKVEISDARTIKDKVSYKKNTYGMEMAAIIAQNDVADTLKKAIEAELKNRGFELGEELVLVSAELSKYYCDFKTGLVSGRAVAEVVMNVQVKKADKSILYSKVIAGENSHTVQLSSGKNAKFTLDAALRDAISKLFNDTSFIDSLLKASKNQFAASKTSSSNNIDPTARSQPPVSKKPQVSAPITPTPAISSGIANTITVIWTFANVRTGAGNNYPVLTAVKQGDKLTVIGEYGDWFNVRLENGQVGWISNVVVGGVENIYAQPLEKDVQPLKKDAQPLKKDAQPLKKDVQPLKKDAQPLEKDVRALKKHTFEIGPEISYRTYEEPGLMKEEGWMYGLVGSYAYHNKLMLKVEARGNWGEVDYSSPKSGEIDDISDYMLEGRGLLGYDFLIAQVHSITPYVGVGYRYLNDDGSGRISTTLARFYERESNYLYSPIGLEANVQLGNKFYLKGITEFDYFWRGWQISHLSDADPGLNDPINTQKNGYGLRGFIGFLIVTKKIDFEAGPFIVYWNIKESDEETITYYGIPTGIGSEPKNNTTEIGFKITARF